MNLRKDLGALTPTKLSSLLASYPREEQQVHPLQGGLVGMQP